MLTSACTFNGGLLSLVLLLYIYTSIMVFSHVPRDHLATALNAKEECTRQPRLGKFGALSQKSFEYQDF
jgi:hypothetical protein